MARAYLSLGSNIEPAKHLRQAVAALRERFGKITLSRLYRTAAVGFEGPAFLNASAAIDTELSPEALDAWLHALEDALGRRRDGPRFSSRTLDIDLLLYDDRVLKGASHLQLPRPELAAQAFVLGPTAEIAPQLVHPTDGRTLGAMWQAMNAADALVAVPWDSAD
ncbi:2-amino-4-hydroxy-6-hydroxymethyldihydropteridine diphosphokinase [Oleiagrimonas sp. C23AA]|uniref:2-amino-4-hydroxy-6- hydroxymethyldihydropteridine diphosphokinase n=1 Tax=Oleiagrimonas sp. C23AA TaxID=2719047 RepID=UPI00141E2517|nr:2-amino-4-hydroxy-6-hydroxymethyldihydropteridine diphosphokinase [Oleiagrimonas sp. C23AA]NII11387.1 2-amino-4-hydroxy-6-hydroxymethyldihydropteridine diphosphokinase [Oleiagrimonas sp. C23AA]